MEFITTEKYDRRRKYYMVLDCETATLPYAQKFMGKARQDVAIAKPLIYDLGWQIIDRHFRKNPLTERSTLFRRLTSNPNSLFPLTKFAPCDIL